MLDKAVEKIIKNSDYMNMSEIVAGLFKAYNDCGDADAYILAMEILEKFNKYLVQREKNR